MTSHDDDALSSRTSLSFQYKKVKAKQNKTKQNEIEKKTQQLNQQAKNIFFKRTKIEFNKYVLEYRCIISFFDK